MNLQGMIFDLDGTLADTLPVCIQAHRYSFEVCLGRTYSDEEIVAMFGPSEEGIIQRWVPEDQWDRCLQAFLDEYDRAHAACTSPFEGMQELLERLQQRGMKLAIVTGKGQHSADISIRRLGLAPYFELVETGAPEGVVKPRCITRILEAWQMPPSRAAYVGDALADVRSAREAGVLPLAAAWAGSADPDGLEAQRPAAVFRSVSDFARWLEVETEDVKRQT